MPVSRERESFTSLRIKCNSSCRSFGIFYERGLHTPLSYNREVKPILGAKIEDKLYRFSHSAKVQKSLIYNIFFAAAAADAHVGKKVFCRAHFTRVNRHEIYCTLPREREHLLLLLLFFVNHRSLLSRGTKSLSLSLSHAILLDLFHLRKSRFLSSPLSFILSRRNSRVHAPHTPLNLLCTFLTVCLADIKPNL